MIALKAGVGRRGTQAFVCHECWTVFDLQRDELPQSSREEQDHVARLRFSARLAHVRRRCGLSLPELAERAGLHQNHLGPIERAEREPRLTTILRICAALDISPGQLLRGLPPISP